MKTQKYPKTILKDIKTYFEEERAHTVKRIAQMDEEDPYKDPDHANDNADILNEVREEMAHQQSEANRAQLEKKLQEIGEVLKRIDDGTYGFCKKCGKMINTERLSSNPYTVLCIDDAKK